MADKKPPVSDPADPQQEALFREVDEAVREEQFAKLWKRHGHWVIAAAVAVVLVVAGNEGWKAWRSSVQTADAQAYEQAAKLARDGKRPEAAEALGKVAASASTGYRALAALQQAALLAEDGKTAEAVAIYDRLATAGDIDPALRDLARLLKVQHGLNGGDAQALTAALVPLADPANPYHHLALEMQGALALKAGQTDRAKEIFSGLAADATAPSGLRQRARDLAASLSGAQG